MVTLECVDFKCLNTQVKMHSYPVFKLEELLLDFNDCKYFSKLDLKKTYLQVALDEKSQDFLVMNTHKGMFKFKRLPYGISAASGIFQRFISELLQGVIKARTYFDDILIGGATEQELYENTKKVLELLQNRNILLNINKCIYNKTEIFYLGIILTSKGIKTDKTKNDAIYKCSRPTNVSALRSVLGMCVQYSKFIKNYSSILNPLYNLTHDNVKFEWSDEHEKAFIEIKNKLRNAEILDTFKPNSKLILEVGASNVGLGAVLKQEVNNKITTIAFGSKKLSSAEENYSQIDKEALAIVFGVKRSKNI